MRAIVANTPRGQFAIPAALVARDRANYYEKQEPGCYQQEFDDTFGDDFELVDWLTNNMDWADVEDSAEKVSDRVLVTDADFWTSSDDFFVREVPGGTGGTS